MIFYDMNGVNKNNKSEILISQCPKQIDFSRHLIGHLNIMILNLF